MMKYSGRLSTALVMGLTALAVLTLLAAPVFGSAGEAGPKGWQPTDTWRIVNFVVLVTVLVLVLRKPVANALQGRIDGIRERLTDLESRKQDAEKELALHSERLASLDKEADEIVARYVQQGKDARTRILEEARAAAEKLEVQAQRQIETAFDRARKDVQSAILDEAISKAEAAIRTKISSEDQDRLVQEYLDKVVA